MTTVTEEWVELEDFPGYSISTFGQVRNDANGRVLHTRHNQFGVPYVGLMRDWRQCSRSLPRLVAETFVPGYNKIFSTPINLNGDRTDCRVENLAWRPRWYAVLYNNQFDDRYENPINAEIVEADTDDVFPDSLSAAASFGLLERDVVLSILNNTLTWPTFQRFVLLD